MFKCPARSKLKCFHLRLIRYDNLLSFFSPPLSLWLIGNSKVTKKNKININNFYIGRYPIYKKKMRGGVRRENSGWFCVQSNELTCFVFGFCGGDRSGKIVAPTQRKVWISSCLDILLCTQLKSDFHLVDRTKKRMMKKVGKQTKYRKQGGVFPISRATRPTYFISLFFLLSLFSFVGFSFFRWIWRCGVYLRVVLYKAPPPSHFFLWCATGSR